VLIPDTGDQTPLPNPAVFQDQPEPARSHILSIVIPTDGEAEVKLVLQEGLTVTGFYNDVIDYGIF